MATIVINGTVSDEMFSTVLKAAIEHDVQIIINPEPQKPALQVDISKVAEEIARNAHNVASVVSGVRFFSLCNRCGKSFDAGSTHACPIPRYLDGTTACS